MKEPMADSAATDASYDCDFLIVGSGFGGSVSALRLAEKGYRVLVVEKGRRFDKGDFATSNRDLKRWLWMPELVEMRAVYRADPPSMATYGVQLHDAGARIVGACCGSSPDHLRAMRDALVTVAS